MSKTTKKKKIARWLVALMTSHYGTIEAAREAYRVARDMVLADDPIHSSLVAWVGPTGRINVVQACEVQYAGSPDAPYVLPT